MREHLTDLAHRPVHRSARSTHTQTVAMLAWLPDDSDSISGGWAARSSSGMHTASSATHHSWGMIHVYVTDLAVMPNMRRVVTLGMYHAAAQNGAVTLSLTPVSVSVSGRCQRTRPRVAYRTQRT
jgi:hypothetical protein